MPRTNADIVRAWCDAVNRRDFGQAAEMFDPEVELRYPDEFPGAGTYRGLEQAGKAFSQELEAWADYRMEIEELVEAGSDALVAAIKEVGRGRTSGVEAEVVVFSAWTFSDGRVAKVHFFMERDQALEAAGVQT